MFSIVIKKELEKYFRKQIKMIKDGKDLPRTDVLASAVLFIDERTGLLKSRGWIGYAI